MAQLKDTIVSGNLRVTDTTLTDTLHVTIIKAPTSSSGSTYGPGESGQVLTSNGSSTYWGAANNHSHNYIPTSAIDITNNTDIGLDSTKNGFGYVNNVTKADWNYQQKDGILIRQVYSNLWKLELYGDYRTGHLSVRGKNNGTWQNWLRILDEGNYTTFTYSSTASRTANTVLAAPNGSAGAATFRKLVTADLPDSYLSTSGGTVSGTLVLSKTQDASGTANNSPALIVGGAATSTHLELDSNEIMAKTNGTSTAALYINNDGGNVYINNNLAARHTATPTSDQVVITDGTGGGIKSSGYTIAKSVPSNAKFTDENVLQSDTSSTSDFRPILLGTTHTTTVSDLSATITGQAYVSSNIFVKPNTGIICAKEFSTVSYINGTGAHLEQYGLYLKSYKAAALPAGGNYSCKGYVVRTYDGKSANNGGMLLTIDGGGLTIVGSGSASSLADLISDDQQDSNTSRTRLDIGGTLNTDYHGASEYLILSSNKSIVFLTNCKTIADRKPVVLDTALRFYPGTTETGSIGISSYQWNTIYGKTIYENGTSLASKYAAIGHTHGLLHSDLNQASTNGTTGGWSVIGIDPTVAGYVLKSIRINQTSPNWLSGDFGAGIAFGGSDTKGVISMRYQYPVITFAGGNHNSSKTEPTWYLKISGTSGSTYNLANFYDSTISRTANTVLAAPNGSDGTASFRKLVAADLPDSYLPTAGGTMEGNISFKSISGNTYPIASNKIIWNGGTDGIDIYYNLRSDDAGELIMNMRDDTNVRISFAYKGTVKSYIDTNGNFSGNAATSSSWATARTLTLGGQLTGSVSVKGDANMTLNGYLDRAFIYDDNAVPSGHTWAEYAWHKFAEVTITDVYEDRVITFLVSRTHGSSAENTGILSAKLRTKENKVYDSAQLKWLVRNYGLSKDDFVMVYTSTSGTSTKAELWCRLPDQYHGLVFTVLKEHRRNLSASSDWTLVDIPKGSSTHGSSSYPTTGITDKIISSDGTITNSTTGTATSANALNITHSNELNFSKLASTGHVWFGYRWNTQGTETSGGTTITTYKFGNANGAGGLAGLEATTSTFKSGNFGDQLIVERTGGANMAGITFKNTSGVLGYIAANTVNGDLYHYGAILRQCSIQYLILIIIHHMLFQEISNIFTKPMERTDLADG